jgi:hypothetical protein
MKAATILLVAGTVGLVSPAVAGSAKKREAQKPVVASVEKTDAAPAAETPAPLAALTAELPTSSPEMLAMPELPVDMSSALVPFPELEKKSMTLLAKPAKSAKAAPPAMKMGKNYVLGGRESAKPTHEVERIIPKSLTQSQVATVVQSHMTEIQHCWTAVPKTHRADACTADLKLSIAEDGSVTDVEIGGDLPGPAHKCMTQVISKWSFPVAETNSDVEYGISLRSL